MIEVMVAVLMSEYDKFTYSEYDSCSIGTLSYSRGWVWDLRTKLCCITSGK